MKTVNQNQIRWNNKTVTTLKIAVNTFNKKISELERTEARNYIPEKINFQDIKKTITTESELKRVVKNLRSIRTEGNAGLYVNEAGQEMTVWEHKMLQKNVRRAVARIDKQIESLNEPISDGFSRAQMGSIELRTLEARRKNLLNFNMKKGFEFSQIKKSANYQGSSDYDMKKAIVYKENYIDVLKRYQGFFGYEFLQEQLRKLSNPIDFYNKFKNGNEFTVDLTYQSTQTYTFERFVEFLKDVFGEEEFNKWLEKQNEKDKNFYNETVSDNRLKTRKSYKYRLEVDGKIVSQADNKSILNKQALDLKGNIRVIEN